jgi:hypothetical protein
MNYPLINTRGAHRDTAVESITSALFSFVYDPGITEASYFAGGLGMISIWSSADARLRR